MADIIDLVYADHDWLRRQFFRLDDAKSKDELAAVWDVLSMRLDAHADAEETVFYPALLKHGGRESSLSGSCRRSCPAARSVSAGCSSR